MTNSSSKRQSIFRQFDPARDKRDAEITRAHEEAVARGEARRLVRTVEGELFSYKREEIGFITGGSGAKITTGVGMLCAGTLCWLAVLALGTYLAFLPGASAGELAGLIFVLAMFGALGWYFMHLGRAEHRARALRRARGLPKPNLEWRNH